MQSIWLTAASATWGLLGLTLLLKSVNTLIRIHTSGSRIEETAQLPTFRFDLAEQGTYEISVKRSSLVGAIPKNNSFRIDDLGNGQSIGVTNYHFLTSKRTDMSGNRIVPVAEFTIDQPGMFQFINATKTNFSERDKLLIAPKASGKSILMILAIVVSGALFISGLVFFILSLLKKMPA
jgi:hypothetical protein